MFIRDDDDEELDLGEIELEDGDDEDGDDTNEDWDEDSEEEDDSENNEKEVDVKAKSSRGNERIRKLANARREAERENIELKRQLDAARAQTNTQVAPQNNLAARQAWLNSLPAEQRSQAEFRIAMADHAQQMQLQQFKIADTSDKAQFDARAVNSPVHARYAARVEQKLQELRTQQGITAPREDVLKHIVGEAVLKMKNKGTSKKDAKASVVKNKVKPNATKKNDISGGVRAGKTVRDRLEGVKF